MRKRLGQFANHSLAGPPVKQDYLQVVLIQGFMVKFGRLDRTTSNGFTTAEFREMWP